MRATQKAPLEWWTSRATVMETALDRFREAVEDRRLSHASAVPTDDTTLTPGLRLGMTLTRHVLNARRRRMGRNHLGIGKEHAKSPRKIDAAMAAVLAYEARADAVAQGVTKKKKRSGKLRAF